VTLAAGCGNNEQRTADVLRRRYFNAPGEIL
jgi:hypothetical protein